MFSFKTSFFFFFLYLRYSEWYMYTSINWSSFPAFVFGVFNGILFWNPVWVDEKIVFAYYARPMKEGSYLILVLVKGENLLFLSFCNQFIFILFRSNYRWPVRWPRFSSTNRLPMWPQLLALIGWLIVGLWVKTFSKVALMIKLITPSCYLFSVNVY